MHPLNPEILRSNDSLPEHISARKSLFSARVASVDLFNILTSDRDSALFSVLLGPLDAGIIPTFHCCDATLRGRCFSLNKTPSHRTITCDNPTFAYTIKAYLSQNNTRDSTMTAPPRPPKPPFSNVWTQMYLTFTEKDLPDLSLKARASIHDSTRIEDLMNSNNARLNEFE